MRRSRRIYKRKSRSNLETLIILIGAIIILSVAFYMAREKSFLPPEENEALTKNTFEEQVAEADIEEQRPFDELIKQTEDKNVREDVKTTDISKELQGESTFTNDKNEEISDAAKSSKLSKQGSTGKDNVSVDADVEEDYKKENAINIISEQVSKTGQVFTVQVGYFSLESNAIGLASEIKKHGFRTYVLKKDDAYKVQVGTYEEREEAEKASKKLKNLGYEIWVTQR